MFVASKANNCQTERMVPQPARARQAGKNATPLNEWPRPVRTSLCAERINVEPKTRSRFSIHFDNVQSRSDPLNQLISLERVKGIEPSSEAWEAPALPLSYTRAPRS